MGVRVKEKEKRYIKKRREGKRAMENGTNQVLFDQLESTRAAPTIQKFRIQACLLDQERESALESDRNESNTD